MDKKLQCNPLPVRLSELKKALFVLPDGTVGTYQDWKEFDNRQYFNTGGEETKHN